MTCHRTLLLFVFVFFVISSVNSLPKNPGCDQVREIFGELNITHLDQIPPHPVNGEMLRICSSEKTCCTWDIENNLIKPVQNGFKDMLKSSISFLKTMLDKDAYTFRDEVLTLINNSRTHTFTILEQVHHVSKTSVSLVNELYDSMSRHMYGDENTDIRTEVLKFFKALYPEVFINDIANLKSVTPEARECIASSFDSVQPFQKLPENLSDSMDHAFLTARAMTRGLAEAYSTVRATEGLGLSDTCAQALVRLTHCSACSGIHSTQPCPGFCLNVVRGCLAHLAELDQPWQDLLFAIQRISVSMVGRHNVQMVLSSLSSRISGGVLTAVDQSPKLQRKISEICGIPSRAKREATIDYPPLPLYSRLQPHLHAIEINDTIFSNLQIIAHQLAEAKDFYGNLGETLCKDVSVSNGKKCWNGRTLGEYNVPLVAHGVEAQTNNTETGPVKPSPAMEMIRARLLAVTGTLLQRVDLAPIKSYSKVADDEGSGGSGHWTDDGSLGDDEDFHGSGEEGSGRIDGDDNSFPHGDPADNEIVPPSTGGGVASYIPNLTVVTLASLLATVLAQFSFNSHS